MPTGMLTSAWLRAIAGLLLIAAIWTPCRGEADLPGPSSQAYKDAVSAFYTGLAAVQVGEMQRAEGQLTQVTELAPQEPAAWANLGVVALRRNDFEQAAERLEEARSLAPENSQLHYLLGVLAQKQGQLDEAVERLRRAVELDAQNLTAASMLAQVIEQRGDAEDTAEARQALGTVLEAQPDNLAVLVEHARLAAKQGDAATLQQTLTRLDDQAGDWPASIREQLQAVREAAEASDLQRAATQITFLKNDLKQLPAYRDDQAAVQTPAGQTGVLLTHFLRLPAPEPQLAPRDTGLQFTAQPLPVGKGPWTWTHVIPLADEGPPSELAANGEEVWVETGFQRSQTLPFPGGASQTPPSYHGIVGLDYDYDFRVDLALAGAGGIRLFRQRGDAGFTDVTADAIPPDVRNDAYAGAWTADLDMEGDIDLVLATPDGPPVVLRNNGDGTFARQRRFEDVKALRDFAWANLDLDGDADAVLLDASGGLRVLANRRRQNPRFQPYSLPVETSDVIAFTITDVNSDGTLDLLTLDRDGAIRRLSHTDTGWTAVQLGEAAGFPSDAPVGGARLFAEDLDNNGGSDLLVSTPSSTQTWLQDQDNQLRPYSTPIDAHVYSVADPQERGRLDLIGLSSAGEPVQLVNRGAKEYDSKSIRPRAARARGDQRINPFGLGGAIEMRAGLMYQKRPIMSPIVHFGLGEYTGADVARIIWPNGAMQAEFDLLSTQTTLTRQRLKGSCPWVFTGNGEEMEFITDFLWRTALGLRINAQGDAQVIHSKDWIKIEGGQLAPTNGAYDVRITADLWETHFFDEVALMAVDHPAGTEVFIDERFKMPPPEWTVHATAPPQPVAKARDQEGRDVTDLIRKRDGQYLDTFELGPYQGLAEEHYVELDLGDEAPADGPLWLVASGWVYPTDTSINLAISQGDQKPPHGLTLEVPDGDGGWTVAEPDLGFPAGKTKTMLIDLSEAFAPGTPRRVRLRTNMEIYWDRLAWAAGRPETPVQTRRLSAQTAELRHRGFSEVHQASRKAPELPNYEEIAATTQQWLDLEGYYTRFGDIRELIESTDDRYVIMNAGDELVFRFPALAPPPEGWERDFILIGDGWVKDGDYNTGYSTTVRPLPYHGITDYSEPPGRLEDDPAYRRHPEDWQTYHTRYVTPKRINRALTFEPVQ